MLLIFTGSSLEPSEYSKKQQFIYCRDLLYTTYPEAINQIEWRYCMNKEPPNKRKGYVK